MGRLTNKTDCKEGTTIGMPKAVACYWKLKKYEDILEKHNMSIDEIDSYITEHKKIEQELGVDLITYMLTMKNGIYCLEQPGYRIVYLAPYFVGMDTFGEWHYTTKTTVKSLKDFGKTWALDKQTLEKKYRKEK